MSSSRQLLYALLLLLWPTQSAAAALGICACSLAAAGSCCATGAAQFKHNWYQGGHTCRVLLCCAVLLLLSLTTRTGVTQMMYIATASWICIHLQDITQHHAVTVALLLAGIWIACCVCCH
jgi:hypothetical protein